MNPFQITTFIILFLIVIFPIIVVGMISFSERWGETILPTKFSLKWWKEWFASESASTISNTFLISGSATLLSLIFGTYASYILIYKNFRGKGFLQSMIMSPLYIANVIIGLGFLIAFVPLRGTFWIMFLGHFIIATPVSFRPIYAVISKIKHEVVEAAKAAGASDLKVFTSIILPLAKPGLLAGAALAFGWCATELGLTLMVYGPSWRTLSVLAYNQSQAGMIGLAAVTGTILITIALSNFFITERY